MEIQVKKQLAVLLLSMFNVSFASGLSDRADPNAQPTVGQKWEISHPTCLHPKPWGGYTLSEMLEMRLCCLNGFVETFQTDIAVLNDKGLFAGEVNAYDPEIMKILHKIFTNEGRGENWDSVTNSFDSYPNDFFKDIDGLWMLIKSRESQPEPEVRALLEEMLQPFLVVRWCATYYWNHRGTYIQNLKSAK
jgi:hypothetical protein